MCPISAHCGPQTENLGANLRDLNFSLTEVIQYPKKRYLSVIDVPDQMVTPAGHNEIISIIPCHYYREVSGNFFGHYNKIPINFSLNS